MKVIPWSYSLLTSFEMCPFKCHQTRIVKTFKDDMGQAAKDGIAEHEQIELWLKDQPAPNLKDHHKSLITDLLEQSKAIVDSPVRLVEESLGITIEGAPCGFWDNECFYRGKLDFVLVQEEVAILFDWKTGKVKYDNEQLKANSILVFAHYPKVETCMTRFAHVNHDIVIPGIWKRWMIKDIMSQFKERVKLMEQAEETGFWPKKKNGLCKNYCPVHTCEHNGNFKGDIA